MSEPALMAEAFRYCPACRHPNPEPGVIPFRCAKCSFTFFFGPVAAVGGLIINSRGRLLLVRRSRDPGAGKWGLPGGFVDRNETIESALHREIMEETGLKVTRQTLLTTGPNSYTYQGVTADVVDLFYVCRVASTRSIQLAADELSEYRWCIPGKDELDDMAFPSNRMAVRVWLDRRRSQ
ncbi:MAG: NUDIX domain-containing protein [Planctomycetota bacterium]